MKAGFWDYVRAAFNARPLGMFVPPNWVGLLLFALLGLVNQGFWLIGGGLELAYLYTLVNNPRFQRYVRGARAVQTQQEQQSEVAERVGSLGEADQRRYRYLESRCQGILRQQQAAEAAADLAGQREGLGRLLWMYLRLLLTRQSITRVLRESAAGDGGGESLDQRVARLEAELRKESLGVELRKSFQGQLDILQQRRQSQQEAKQKLVFLDAELTRIQEQVELIREQAVFSTDPATVSQRIDQIAATLGETGQWIREQQQLYGKVEDLLSEPPPIALEPAAAKEAQ